MATKALRSLTVRRPSRWPFRSTRDSTTTCQDGLLWVHASAECWQDRGHDEIGIDWGPMYMTTRGVGREQLEARKDRGRKGLTGSDGDGSSRPTHVQHGISNAPLRSSGLCDRDYAALFTISAAPVLPARDHR